MMFASLSTWTLDPSLTDGAAVPALLRHRAQRDLPASLERGLLDTMLLSLPPDQVVEIAVYGTATDAHAGGIVAQRIGADGAQTVRLHHHVIGQLLTAVLPDEDDLLWRAQVSELHATWAIWRVAPHLRRPGALERFVREGYERFTPLLRRLGLIDMLMVRTTEDEVAILNLYADPVVGQAAYAEAVAAVADYIAGHMERIATSTGKAFDLAMLLGRAA
jgi:hypothetical protein